MDSDRDIILIAEHDPEIRDRLAALARDMDCDVVQAEDTRGLRAAVKRGDLGLILLDGQLPGSDALELCREWGADGGTVPVVLLVQPDQALDPDAASGTTIVDFLQHPVHPELLRHAVRRGLAPTTAQRGFPVRVLNGTVADLLAFVSAQIPVARRESKHVAVMHVEVSDESSGGSWDQLDEQSTGGMLAFLDDCFHGIFEHQTDRETLLAPRAGICSVRTGTSTFVIAIPELDRVQDAVKLASRIHERLSRPTQVAGRDTTLTASIGIAAYPEDGADPRGLVDCAQIASSRSALEGRNSLEYFTESMSRWVFERLTLENSLRDALGNDELIVYYQPRVDIHTRRILGMEALVRWQHPQLGIVSPAQFIPLAEELGLVGPIDEWVLNEACRQNKKWRDMGLPPVRVSVNLSPIQFRQPDLYEKVCGALQRSGLSHDGLELEVTESMLMHDPRRTTTTLRQLKSAGITISIDDFGTGYSSLSYLKQFPIDALKIDRSFVREVTTNADDAAIATAIILMGHSLKLEVVAEGVETESQLSFLKVLQCNEIQGFLISRPVPWEKAELLLRAQMSAAA